MNIDKFYRDAEKMSAFDVYMFYDVSKRALLKKFEAFFEEHKNENGELILVNPTDDLVEVPGKVRWEHKKEHAIKYDIKNCCYVVVYEDGFEVPMDHKEVSHASMDMFRLASAIFNYEEEMKRIEDEKKSMRKLHFENEDIIITDPCYVINEHKKEIEAEFGGPEPKYQDFGMTYEEYCMPPKDYSKETQKKVKLYGKARDKWRKIENKYDDWDKTNCGSNYERVGVKNFITRNTIYGDWSCTTFNSDTKEAIGQFCADAGLVSVFSLAEVRAYNPDVDKWIEEHDWCVTKIPNFTGDVWFEVVHHEGIYDEDRGYTDSEGKYHCWAKKGDKWEEDEVRVVGQGNINFVTSQTGL